MDQPSAGRSRTFCQPTFAEEGSETEIILEIIRTLFKNVYKTKPLRCRISWPRNKTNKVNTTKNIHPSYTTNTHQYAYGLRKSYSPFRYRSKHLRTKPTMGTKIQHTTNRKRRTH